MATPADRRSSSSPGGGIRPYTAFLGALKLRDEVEVEFDVDLIPGS
jgi:hypothetical protein